MLHPAECDPETQFDCGNKHCIPINLVCDTKNDCGDFEDEPHDLCCKFYIQHLIIVLVLLTYLLKECFFLRTFLF